MLGKRGEIQGAGCGKPPNQYVSRIFSKDRDHKTKERGEFRTFGTGGAHDPGHKLEGLIRITYQCDTQVALVATSNFYHQIQKWVCFPSLRFSMIEVPTIFSRKYAVSTSWCRGSCF